MSSRLFHAVVGLGIALGTASVACLGAVEPQVDDASNDPGTTTPPSRPRNEASTAADPDPNVGADAGVDARDTATVKDAAILDAFCDAAWPTTKGNPGGPTCGPVAECSEAGPAPGCFRATTTSVVTCDPHPPVEVAYCIAGQWQCSGGGVPGDKCVCWTGSPCASGGQ